MFSSSSSLTESNPDFSSSESHSSMTSSSEIDECEEQKRVHQVPAPQHGIQEVLSKGKKKAKLVLSANALKKKRKTPKNKRRGKKGKADKNSDLKASCEGKGGKPDSGQGAVPNAKIKENSSIPQVNYINTDANSASNPASQDGSSPTSIVVCGVRVSKRVLGKGTFATVHPGVHLKTGKKVAVKVVEMDEDDKPESNSPKDGVTETRGSCPGANSRQGNYPRKRGAEGARRGVVAEIYALSNLRNHRNVVKLHYHEELYDMMFLVMEYAPGKNLSQMLQKRGKFREQDARWIFAQVISAVNYCHTKNIAHHDLKPANIIVDEHTMTIKLVDFGLCIINTAPGKKCQIFSGTPLYCALEILLRKPYDPFMADVWALGVVLFEMLCDDLPWNAKTYEAFVHKVAHEPVQYPMELSASVVRLISKMIEPRVCKRIALSDLATYSWLSDVW